MRVISESQRQTSILKYLKKNYPNAVVLKLHEDPVFGVVGLPDIMFAHNGSVCFFEVKKPGEQTSKSQEVMLQKLLDNGIMAQVVYSTTDVERMLCDIPNMPN